MAHVSDSRIILGWKFSLGNNINIRKHPLSGRFPLMVGKLSRFTHLVLQVRTFSVRRRSLDDKWPCVLFAGKSLPLSLLEGLGLVADMNGLFVYLALPVKCLLHSVRALG